MKNWLDKYQDGGEIAQAGITKKGTIAYNRDSKSELLPDLYTNMMHGLSTFGASAVGDFVDGISPKAADWLEKYTAGFIPHTTEEKKQLNRSSNSNAVTNRINTAIDTGTNIEAGILLGGAFNKVIPMLPNAMSTAKNYTKAGINATKSTIKNANLNLLRDLPKSNTKLIKDHNYMVGNFYKDLTKGAKTINKTLENKLKELNSPEGKRRLLNQERDYLESIGFNPEHITRQSHENYNSRIFELEHTKVFGNKNQNMVDELGRVGPNNKDLPRVYENLMDQEGIPIYNAFAQRQHPADNDFLKLPEDKFMTEENLNLARWTGYITEDATSISLKQKRPVVGAIPVEQRLALGYGYGADKGTAYHEINHLLQRGRKMPLDRDLKSLEVLPPHKMSKENKNDYKYFYSGSKGNESSSYLAETRQAMKDKGFIKNTYDNVTPEIAEKAMAYFKKNPQQNVRFNDGAFNRSSNTRILEFAEPSQFNYDLLSRSFNRLPAAVPVTGAIGIGAGTVLKNPEEFQNGGVIKDDRGQWEHPGEITEIGSNQITMQGVPYPVLGISDTGDQQMMYPGQDYKYEGTKVTEYPLVKNGGWLSKYAQDGEYIPYTTGVNELEEVQIIGRTTDEARARGNLKQKIDTAKDDTNINSKVSIKSLKVVPKKVSSKDLSLLTEEFNNQEYLNKTEYRDPRIASKFLDNTREYDKQRLEQSGDNLSTDIIPKYYKKYDADKKSSVENIQKKLIAEGFLPEKNKNGKSNIDGKFGDLTKEALLEYNTANTEEDTKGLVFSQIPKKVDDTRCTSGMCEILELNNIDTEEIGAKYTDAWNLRENMLNTGNNTPIYNIYDNKAFKGVNKDTPIETLKQITQEVKRKSQTKSSDYKVGDVVGLFWAGSDHHQETLNSKTFNTHSGFVSSIKNGVPIITHNVNGIIKNQPYDQLVTTWINRPNKDTKIETSYASQIDNKELNNTKVDNTLISNLEQKLERKFSAKEKGVVSNIMQRSQYNSVKIPKLLKSTVNSEWLNQATFAIIGVETGGGINADRSREDLEWKKSLVHNIKDTKDKNISLGVGKVKFSTLDNFSKAYFNVHSAKDLGDDKKSVDIIAYQLTKNYETFKDYAKQYPMLNLQEEDIRNMAILSHNQGNSKLLKVGRNKENKLSSKEELEALRALYEGTITDISSTNYSHIPVVGNTVYKGALATGLKKPAETYISKTNRYINEVFTPPNKIAINSSPRTANNTRMENGGELHRSNILSNFTGKTNWLNKYN